MSLVFLRRVVGKSMYPRLKPGKLVVATSFFKRHRLRPGQVVIVQHDGREKIKRIERIEDDKLFVIGDYLAASSDSRHFGWLSTHDVRGRVIWPRLLNN